METVHEYDSSRHQHQRGSVGVRSASNSSNYAYLNRFPEHTIALYPGEAINILFKVYGPEGRGIVLRPVGFPYHVARLSISPSQGIAPFTAKIVITASEMAQPGIYSWSLHVYDTDAEVYLGNAQVKLVILPSAINLELYRDLKSVYRKYGIQVALWIALRTAYPSGAPFSAVKGLYEVIVNSTISKGTVGNILSVMLKKGMVTRTSEGYYKAVEMGIEELIARVDARRVRPYHAGSSVDSMQVTFLIEVDFNKLPENVKQAYTLAQDICSQHGVLAALYFLLHTLMGVRKTGFLLVWDGNEHLFIVCEPKTHLCHYYYSLLLSTLLRKLGLVQGVYYPSSGQHDEARKIAEEYINKHYGGYKNARKLHYALRELGYVGNFFDDEAHIVKIYHGTEGDIGVDVYDYAGKRKLASYGMRDEYVKNIETWMALPVMHIDKRNEETYFVH